MADVHRFTPDHRNTRCGADLSSVRVVDGLDGVTCEACRTIEYVEPAPVLAPPDTPIQAEWRERIAKMFRILSLPPYMLGGVTDFVLYGQMPGGFLTSVLSNDFRGALGQADDANANAIARWINALNYLPDDCWGSHQDLTDWREHQGLKYQPKPKPEEKK